MTDVLELGSTFRREGAVRFSLRGVTAEGGPSLSGLVDVARLDGGGFWEAEFSSIFLRTADHIRYWRAIEALADGGVTEFIVPSCESKTAPWPIVNGRPLRSVGSIPHSDGSLFSDGSGYHQDIIECTVAAVAAFRATTISLLFAVGGPLRGGETFSIEHPTKGWRRYHVGTVTDNDDGSQTVTFRPPLREAATSGTPVNFDLPKCIMRLASLDAMDLTLEMRRFARPSVRFREAF